MKRIVLVFFVTLLVFTSTTFISGAKPENTPKEEVVYGILDSAGNLQKISVVNGFVLEKDATIADYGDYASVQNLSSDAGISRSGSFINFAGKAGRVNYQGELVDRQLPWAVKISYFLNGQPITPEDLTGKSGKLKLNVQTSRNTLENGSFFDDFSLQISIPMKMDLCKNILTSGATVADNGSNKQFSYVVLPGENGSIAITADVTNFEMDAITLAGIRMAFDLPLDVNQINQSLNQLVSAASKLDSGAVGLLEGADALKTGLQKYTDGFELLNSQLGSLESGANSLETGIIGLSGGLQALSAQGASLVAGAQSIQDATFLSANAQLSGIGITVTPQDYKTVLASLPQSDSITALVKQLDDITTFVVGVNAYTLGTTHLAVGAVDLKDGAASLSDGITTLAGGLSQLYGSTITLNNSMKTFLEGVATYRAGTKSFSAGTTKMEKELGNQLDSLLSMLSSDGKVYHSYVSSDNTNVNFVQFVIKTGGISAEVTAPATEPTPIEKSLWQKFLDLFR